MEYVLETNGLSKRYRDFTALNRLNMHIPKDSIYRFVGRNDAGKTSPRHHRAHFQPHSR